MALEYKQGTDSTVGENIVTFYHYKKALIDVAKEQYFGQLADVITMPKHYGKTIKTHHYLPLLDDRNVNDQGLDATGATISDGNLYGSSKDIGTIQSKIPTLSESGGRVNRVGFKRETIEGTIQKLGFFSEFTQDSLDFDDDSELVTHITRESLRGANEIVEDLIQIDVLNGAGVTLFGGDATATVELTGEDAAVKSELTYDMLVKMNTELNNNRCPRNTQIIAGSRMVDTKTIPSARYLYMGSELKPTILKMTDYHGNKAFIPVQHYAEAGTVARGEQGSIDNFRIIEVPEMAHWASAGAAVTTNGGYRTTDDVNYDVFPVLCVGSNSFSTIGFQTDGKSVKFKVIMKKPGEEMADTNNPYGEVGFYSVKWFYGTMILRPEWIALAKVVAEI